VAVTSSVGINQVWKSPYVSDADREPHARENKLPLGAPFPSVDFFLAAGLHIFLADRLALPETNVSINGLIC